MLRLLSGVSLRDRVRNTDVAQRFGLFEILDETRVRRLKWFGQVQRREEGEALSVITHLQVEGHRPRGRPKKSWQRTVEEDMTLMGIDAHLVSDRRGWREAIERPTPQSGNSGR